MWFVAPDHAGRGLGKRLVGHFDAPGRLLHAFSISEAAAVNFQRLGWTAPVASSLLLLPVPRLAAWRRRGTVECREEIVHDGELPAALADVLDRVEEERPPSTRMRRGAAEWTWRLRIMPESTYRFGVAYAGARPVGYVAVRQMRRGSTRLPRHLNAAMVSDLVVPGGDPEVLRALGLRAAAFAVALDARVLLAVTTSGSQRCALRSLGFLGPSVPVAGRLLQRAAPQFTWAQTAVTAGLSPADVDLTFADADLDFNL
jgi:hypothetical protein